METSGIVAKAVSRLFLLLLVLAIVPLFQVNGNKLKHLYIVTSNKWLLIFPVILVGGFVYFLIRCTINKYREPDSNWLLVLNALILMAYCATIFVRVYQLTMAH
jgi:hypothetical protein